VVLVQGQTRIDDLGVVLVHGQPFANRVSSLRCRIPAGFAFVLYREPGQTGDSPLAIEGGGTAVTVNDLGDHGFGDTARSCAVVALRVAKKLQGVQWVA